MGTEGAGLDPSRRHGTAAPHHRRRRRGCRRARLMCMLALTFVFFLVEVAVSRLTSSLAMLSDSFHMLSDVMALVVALVAVRFAQRTRATSKNTFGWVRAEVMGALVNAVFLTALCFTILLEAVERFTEPHEIQQPLVVIGVGAAGLLVNLLGLCLFHQHGGGGGGGDGGHGHSHRGRRHQGQAQRGKDGQQQQLHQQEETNTLVDSYSGSNGVGMEKIGDSSKESQMELQPNGNVSNHSSLDMEVDVDTSGQLNMRGVFLHVLGDALGSVIVVVNALVFYAYWTPCPDDGLCINPCINDHCAENGTRMSARMDAMVLDEVTIAGPCWVLYLDPALCLIMVCILLYTTYPLLKESALILLQTVPKQIDIRSLNEKLRKLEEVEAVHELHVWQLAGSRIIGTAHIKCKDPETYMKVAKDIKEIFHDEGIHATTIQPEFAIVGSGVDFEAVSSKCELPCRTQCALKQCCEAAEKTSAKKTEKSPSISISCSEIVIDSPHHKTRRTKSECIPVVKLEMGSDPNKQFESSL
ncbi:proton-coupled zinc antiporter SLC30A1 [Anolis carolinensis]|uniref:Solute carrier family 30 member 1 n=2 Tax=Anolis carolinensis TaxID=28377 RepID=G1KSH0_ANOCA|nr:PREDICTED: zinc transporter 1 [Anolis carolinensis]|eukprot:XP_008124023.1 PREDICTED: zinc transporter 1 [Anolis carolinensis]